MLKNGVTMYVMPKNAARSKAKPVTVRIDDELLKQAIAIGDAAPFKPTLTQLIEAALRDFVDKHTKRK